jgi:hypothetical protein
LAGDIALNPDVLVLRWGANDPYFSHTPAQFISDLRYGLRMCRSSKTVQQMAIVLCTPGPMNDITYGRHEVYFQQIADGIRQAAIDYQCAFIDINGMFQNAHDGVGYWMDSDSASGTARGIHPKDVLYTHIAGAIADVIFPWNFEHGRVNGTYMPSSYDTYWDQSSGSTILQYPGGVSMFRMNGSGTNGGPYNGMVMTFKNPDNETLQINWGLQGTTAAAGFAMRHGHGTSFSPWFGAKPDGEALLSNGWSNYTNNVWAGFTYQRSLDGRVYLDGVIKPGTTTDLTIVATLPANYRPAIKTLLVAHAENAAVIYFIAEATGDLKIVGWGARAGASTYLDFHGVSFPTF